MIEALLSLNIYVLITIGISVILIGFVLWLNAHPDDYRDHLNDHKSKHEAWLIKHGFKNKPGDKSRG